MRNQCHSIGYVRKTHSRFGAYRAALVHTNMKNGYGIGSISTKVNKERIIRSPVLHLFARVSKFDCMWVLGLVGAILFYPDAAESLGSGTVISGAIGAIVYLVCIALLGFGLAALLRSTAGSISVLVGVTFVLPIAFQVLSAFGWEWVPKVLAYLPMPLGSLLAGGIPASGVGPSNGPDFWLGLIAIVIWAALPVAGGLAVLKARDAK
ncbi:hypothetical protein FQR65_LT19775 [Abscondita terminalis]|nr:hypothetical protein FQR65_LT19775 [Abscondita terminalis]